MGTCFICRISGSRMCGGHCGACMEGDEPDGPSMDMCKPSGRMYDDRAWLPGVGIE